MSGAARPRSPAKGWSAASTEVGDRASRILLHHRPQLAHPGDDREHATSAAVLGGDNSERPRLLYPAVAGRGEGRRPHRHLRRGRRVSAGPAGRRGRAVDAGGPRVEPYAELSQLGYVRIVDYGLASSLPQPLPLLRRAEPAVQDRQSNGLRAKRRWRQRFSPYRRCRASIAARRDCCRAATTLLAAVISVLPLQIPGFAALTPGFTLMAVYHWTIYRPDLLPPAALFGIGLADDLLAGSPIGCRRAVLLLTRVAVMRSPPLFRQPQLSRSCGSALPCWPRLRCLGCGRFIAYST